MKKLKLIVFSKTPHFVNSGGIQTYARNQISVLKDSFDIEEFVFSDIKKFGKNTKKLCDVFFYSPSDLNGIIAKYANQKNTVIINHAQFLNKKLIDADNHVFVQHADWKEYWGPNIGWKLKLLIKKMKRNDVILGNPLSKSKNVFFYTKNHIKGKVKNWSSYPTPSPVNIKHTTIKFSERKGGLFIGRLEDSQKKASQLLKIRKYIGKGQLRIIGDGELAPKIKDKFGGDFIGWASREEVAESLLKSKALILTSRWEGFPFVLVEAVTAGVPIIFYDTFDGAALYKGNAFASAVKYKNYKEVARQLKEILSESAAEFKERTKGMEKFVEANLSLEGFTKSWKEFIIDVNERGNNGPKK